MDSSATGTTGRYNTSRTTFHRTNNNEMNELEIIELLGPSRDSLETVVPMSILYAVLLLTGTVGNVCTCIVIARNRYMHTATNFYLFSLAISDLLLLILGLPQELFMLWQKYPYVFGEFFCVVRGFSSETSTNASILTITAFTVERYVAICHPLKSHTMSQLPRAIKTILVIWAVSAICALPVAWQFGIIFMINKSPLKNISRQCGIKTVYIEYGFETAAIVFFIVPITLITVLYVLIGINLRRSANQIKEDQNHHHHHNSNYHHHHHNNNDHPMPRILPPPPPSPSSPTSVTMLNHHHDHQHRQHTNHHHHSSSSGDDTSSAPAATANLYQRHNSVSGSVQKQIASRRSVIRMLVAVVIAFFFCYSPFHAQRVLATTMHRYKIKSPTIHYVYVVLTHISGVTYYLSATLNPILYQVMSRKFRMAFRDTFGPCCPCIRNELPDMTYLNMAVAAGVATGTGANQLSRVPSFNSNCSFRRASFHTELESRSYASIRAIHSFDPIEPPPTPTTPSSLGEEKSPTEPVEPPPVRFKQFLDVPTFNNK